MRIAAIFGAISLLGAAPTFAQNTYEIDGIIQITLPDGYRLPPSDLADELEDNTFLAPINIDTLSTALDAYTPTLTADKYLEFLIKNEGWDEETDLNPVDYLKTLTISVLDVSDDEKAFKNSGNGSPPQITSKQKQDICERFFTGFESYWGSGAFFVFDESTGFCHTTNVYGAVIGLHVAVVGTDLVIVRGIDWPIALMPDYIDNPELYDSEEESVIEPTRKVPLNFKTATMAEKFNAYRAGVNTEDAIFVLKSIKRVSK